MLSNPIYKVSQCSHLLVMIHAKGDNLNCVKHLFGIQKLHVGLPDVWES